MQMYPGPDVTSPLLIEPSATEPYYTRSSLTCVGMQMYPGPDVPHPTLIEPSATEP